MQTISHKHHRSNECLFLGSHVMSYFLFKFILEETIAFKFVSYFYFSLQFHILQSEIFFSYAKDYLTFISCYIFLLPREKQFGSIIRIKIDSCICFLLLPTWFRCCLQLLSPFEVFMTTKKRI